MKPKITITSKQNETFKYIKKLYFQKKYRNLNQEFFVDGAHFVKKAIESDFKIKKLIFVEKKIDTDFKKEILKNFPQENKIEFSEELYSNFSTKDHIQGIGAIVKMNYQKNKILPESGIVLENISDPGNLGTIIRTANCFNIKNIYLIQPSVDPFCPNTVRATMGSIFDIKIILVDPEKIDIFKNKNTNTNIATTLETENFLKNFNQKFSPKQNINIFFGNEQKGLSKKVLDLCDTKLKIKINKKVDSLNIAESMAIFTHHLMKI